MAATKVIAYIRIRRGSYEQWKATNPVLKEGEGGLVSSGSQDVGKIKFGNGTTAWNSLPYTIGADGEAAFIDDPLVDIVAPGTPASVVNEGSASEARFHFYIPRGYPGTTVPNIMGLATETSPLVNDFLYIYDSSSNSLKRITTGNLLATQTPNNFTYIPAGTDLNSLLLPGFYGTNDGNVSTFPNRPAEINARGFVLEVLAVNITDAGTAGSMRRIQRLTPRAGSTGDLINLKANVIYQRAYAYDGSELWGPWVKFQSIIDYSTNEQDTGVKWINGRAIYQKTFNYLLPASLAAGAVAPIGTAQVLLGRTRILLIGCEILIVGPEYSYVFEGLSFSDSSNILSLQNTSVNTMNASTLFTITLRYIDES